MLYWFVTGTVTLYSWHMVNQAICLILQCKQILLLCFSFIQVISHIKKTCTRMRLMHNLPPDMSRGQTTATSINFIQHGPDSHESENGNLVYDSPRSSPCMGKKVYNTMEISDRKYPYIPLVTRQQSTSPTET